MNGSPQAVSPRQEAATIKAEWARGAEPDAQAVLARRPDLRADKSVVLDLAYEEYCLRHEAGRAPDPDAFCDRFPSHRESLRVLVAAHQYLADNAHLLAEAGPERWPEPSERLGDFLLLRELGRGGFARVYLAAEESTGGRPVAVKLSPEGAAEARTLGRLVHPNIVPVLSARRQEGVGLTAVCMPFLGAATLADVLDLAYPVRNAPPPRRANVIRQAVHAAARPGDPAPLSAAPEAPHDGPFTEAVARLAGQMSDALAHLHKEGVCHRDLKPSNVLIGPAGQALLLDFNLSADARLAAPRLGGTLPYMAPEQLIALVRPAEPDALDERMDLFSLGVIHYELLTGKHPFGKPPADQPAKQAASALWERQQAGCAPLRTLNPAVDRRLARLVERCLSFDPAGRPASAAALADDFRRYLAPPARLWRGAVRRPWAVALAGVLLLAAATGAAHELTARMAVNGQAAASERAGGEREYQQGREAFLAGDYRRAEEQFTRAMLGFSGDTKPRKYYLAHAAAELKLAEGSGSSSDPAFGVALADVRQAVKQQPDGATMALLGYCSTRAKAYDAAIGWYNQAVQAGFTSAGLCNDRGYSYFQPGRLDEARKDFDAALAIDPNLQPALFNRALLSLQRPSVNPPPLPEPALADMERLLATAAGSQELYFTAARLFAAAALEGGPGDPDGRAKQALLCVQKAVACGLNPDQIRNNPIISAALKADPSFPSALATPPQGSGPKAAPRLVNPAPYVPE